MLDGGDGGDLIVGNAGNNFLYGGNGDDTLYGGDAPGPPTFPVGQVYHNTLVGGGGG